MRLQELLSIAVIFLAGATAPACLNDYRRNEEAAAAGQSMLASITQHKLRSPWAAVRADLAERIKTERTVENLNDYAVALCHTGDPKAAIELLLEIERTRPRAYQTATNLGTAYELAGQNKDALHWIEEGIRRNPLSHEGSEWIHVAILEAKLALAKDPAWLGSHDVLGLDFGKNLSPNIPSHLPKGNSGQALSLREIRTALRHQLRERLQFIPPPDPLVSQLVCDLGSLVELTMAPDAAAPIYQLAAQYGGFGGSAQEVSDSEMGMEIRSMPMLRQPRTAAVPEYRDLASVVGFSLLLFAAASACIVGILLGASLVRRIMKERTPDWIVALATTRRLLSFILWLGLLMLAIMIAAGAKSDDEYAARLGSGIALLAAFYLLASSGSAGPYGLRKVLEREFFSRSRIVELSAFPKKTGKLEMDERHRKLQRLPGIDPANVPDAPVERNGHRAMPIAVRHIAHGNRPPNLRRKGKLFAGWTHAEKFTSGDWISHVWQSGEVVVVAKSRWPYCSSHRQLLLCAAASFS